MLAPCEMLHEVWANRGIESEATLQKPNVSISALRSSNCRTRWSCVAGVFLGLGIALVASSASAQSAPEFTTIHDSGPNTNRVNLVFLGDGYAADDIQTLWVDQVQAVIDHMFGNEELGEPYGRYENFINVHRIDLVSPESGIDRLSQNIFVDTPLGGNDECRDYTVGDCIVDWAEALSTFDATFEGTDIEVHWRHVLLNGTFRAQSHTHRDGRRFTTVPGTDQPDVHLHEGGHAFHGLADLYPSDGDRTYTGAEPSEINVTLDPTGSKWEHWLGFEDPVLGEIGAYEGGKYYTYGLYRPAENSKMRYLPAAFDPIAKERIVLDIYQIVEPIDEAAPEADAPNPMLWVQPVDAAVLKVDWLVDGEPALEDYGPELDTVELGLEPGQYEVTALVYDDTPWVRLARDGMEQSVSWQVTIEALPDDEPPVEPMPPEPEGMEPAPPPLAEPMDPASGGGPNAGAGGESQVPETEPPSMSPPAAVPMPGVGESSAEPAGCSCTTVAQSSARVHFLNLAWLALMLGCVRYRRREAKQRLRAATN